MTTARAGRQRVESSRRDLILGLREGAGDVVTWDCEVSIVMPCLNEAETLAACIDKAHAFLERAGVVGEVLIADNGSSDGSQELALAHGARVCRVRKKGYGAALLGGIAAARGRYVIMGDSDDSYDFSRLDEFVAKLREGYDLVMGNRFKGGIAPGAMPPLHKYLGNPILSSIGRLFFASPCGDFHCGLRGFNKASIERLRLSSIGMEFASEMVVKATLLKLKVTEVPTTLSKDGRSRSPHLRSWRDGWRHLRFLLMYSPRWLFLYPSLVLMLAGTALTVAVLPGPLPIGGVVFDVHTLLYGMGAILLGLQLAIFFLLAKQFAIKEGLLPSSPRFERYREMTSLERGVFVGASLVLLGLVGVILPVWMWESVGYGDLDYRTTMRLLIPALTALLAGVQIAMGAFLSGILDLETRER